MRHPAKWHTAAPLWDLSLQSAAPAAVARFKSPAILRFQSDRFMDELAELLRERPENISQFVARRETWESPAAGWPGDEEYVETQRTAALKLFQPAHGRFYLVAASFTCTTPGLPDRAVDLAAGDRVAFVLRRLVPKTGRGAVDPLRSETADEYGWFGDRQEGSWQHIADPNQVEAGEERLPMFMLFHGFEGERKKRRLHAGLIPVGRREAYESGFRRPSPRTTAAAGTAPDRDPRLADFDQRIVSSLTALAQRRRSAGQSEEEFRRQVHLHFANVLADLVHFLSGHLPDVLAAVRDGSTPGLSQSRKDVVLHIQTALRDLVDLRTFGNTATMTEATHYRENPDARFSPELSTEQITGAAEALLGAAPRALLSLIDAALEDLSFSEFQKYLDEIHSAVAAWDTDARGGQVRREFLRILLEMGDFLRREIPDVLEDDPSLSETRLPSSQHELTQFLAGRKVAARSWLQLLAAAQMHRSGILMGQRYAEISVLGSPWTEAQMRSELLDLIADKTFLQLVRNALAEHREEASEGAQPVGETLYVVRCLYERVGCAQLPSACVSAPSQVFQLAAFFDPDAPGRPVHIRMPSDTTAGGFSRFAKTVSVAMSRKLRQQLAQVQATDPADVLDGNLENEPEFDLGIVCSLSIPIIAICALIMLMVIVQILNIVFFWLPYFKICVPTRVQ